MSSVDELRVMAFATGLQTFCTGSWESRWDLACVGFLLVLVAIFLPRLVDAAVVNVLEELGARPRPRSLELRRVRVLDRVAQAELEARIARVEAMPKLRIEGVDDIARFRCPHCDELVEAERLTRDEEQHLVCGDCEAAIQAAPNVGANYRG